MKHLRYLSYVARHKWFALRAGLRTRAPLWRLLIHDWSKLTSVEWGPYVDTFYGGSFANDGPSEEARQRRFDAAWLHHQHRNPHHWQHWVLWEGDGDVKVLAMPPKLVREMVADWMAAGRASTGRWDVASWYEANHSKIVLHRSTRYQVENLIANYDRPLSIGQG